MFAKPPYRLSQSQERSFVWEVPAFPEIFRRSNREKEEIKWGKRRMPDWSIFSLHWTTPYKHKRMRKSELPKNQSKKKEKLPESRNTDNDDNMFFFFLLKEFFRMLLLKYTRRENRWSKQNIPIPGRKTMRKNQTATHNTGLANFLIWTRNKIQASLQKRKPEKPGSTPENFHKRQRKAIHKLPKT